MVTPRDIFIECIAYKGERVRARKIYSLQTNQFRVGELVVRERTRLSLACIELYPIISDLSESIEYCVNAMDGLASTIVSKQ